QNIGHFKRLNLSVDWEAGTSTRLSVIVGTIVNLLCPDLESITPMPSGIMFFFYFFENLFNFIFRLNRKTISEEFTVFFFKQHLFGRRFYGFVCIFFLQGVFFLYVELESF